MTTHCPLCHVAHEVLTGDEAGDGAFRCSRCGQHWDPPRLAAVAAYAAWLAATGRVDAS